MSDIRAVGWLTQILDGAHGFVAVGVADGPVWGLGPDADAALRDARAQRAPSPLHVLPASPALAQAVAERGGDVPWLEREGAAFLVGEESPEEWCEHVARVHAIPDRAASWAKERRAMLARMARAAALGHPAVRLTTRGGVVWAQPVSQLGTDPHALSEYRRAAAEQVAERLGDDGFLRALEVEASNDAHRRRGELRALGTAVFGEQWVTPVAETLGVALRTAQRWASGERGDAPSDAALADLRERLRPRAAEVARELRRRLAVVEGLL